MRKLYSVLFIVVFVLMFNCGLFAQNACSSATITGRYCYIVSGFADYTGGKAPMVPTSSLGTATLKPTGEHSISVSIAWSQNLGSQVEKLTGSGTATVNDDCTGTGSFTIDGLNFTIGFELVVLDDGKEIRMMPVDPPGLAVSAKFRRISKNGINFN